MKINSIIDLVKDLDTSRQTKNLNKLLIRILLHLQVEFSSFKDAIYQNTRKMIWSGNNPYFFKGKAGEGVGGPHVGLNYIWPMSIIMKAFTTDDSEEIRACLKQLRDTDGGTGFMHESFHSEDAADFTRSWFAWTNTLFGELILKTIKEYPNLLSQML